MRRTIDFGQTLFHAADGYEGMDVELIDRDGTSSVAWCLSAAEVEELYRWLERWLDEREAWLSNSEELDI